MMLLYNLLLPVVMLVYLPLFMYKQLRRGNFFAHLGERFGLFGNSAQAALKRLRVPVWVHAVSVGEVVAALGFIRRWRERDPDQDFVLSCTTTTGRATAESRLPDRVRLIYCPLDLPLIVRRTMRLVRPRMLVIFEVEIWPNLIRHAVRSGARVALVNGRVSDRSAAGYRKYRRFFEPIFRQFSVFCMQSETDAKRIAGIVGENVPVRVCNTMKFDQVPDMSVKTKQDVLDQVFGPGERLVWVAGSTHPGEEALVSDAFRSLKTQFPHLKLVLVPRHQERAAEVEAVLRARGLSYRLLKPAAERVAEAVTPVDVLLVNTTGELMSFYAAADIAFVGKSLAGNSGGHNIIEPAIFGKPILYGVHMENFRLVAEVFTRHQAALAVASDTSLEPELGKLLSDGDARRELGRKARQVVEQYRGAMDKTLDALQPLLVA